MKVYKHELSSVNNICGLSLFYQFPFIILAITVLVPLHLLVHYVRTLCVVPSYVTVILLVNTITKMNSFVANGAP